MSRHRQIAALACFGLLALHGSVRPLSGADPERSLEYPVKAAFLVNFAKFTEWPAESQQAQASVVTICVLGRDPFGDVLEKTAAGRSVGGRPIAIQRHRSLEGVGACHVLFVATSEDERLAQILERLAAEPVLTVGEGDGFTRRGGVIGLVVESNLARFEVNLHAAQRIGLQLSSKLLGVARVVEGGPPTLER
jgi:YfiR/HmsC-like